MFLARTRGRNFLLCLICLFFLHEVFLARSLCSNFQLPSNEISSWEAWTLQGPLRLRLPLRERWERNPAQGAPRASGARRIQAPVQPGGRGRAGKTTRRIDIHAFFESTRRRHPHRRRRGNRSWKSEAKQFQRSDGNPWWPRPLYKWCGT